MKPTLKLIQRAESSKHLTLARASTPTHTLSTPATFALSHTIVMPVLAREITTSCSLCTQILVYRPHSHQLTFMLPSKSGCGCRAPSCRASSVVWALDSIAARSFRKGCFVKLTMRRLCEVYIVSKSSPMLAKLKHAMNDTSDSHATATLLLMPKKPRPRDQC